MKARQGTDLTADISLSSSHVTVTQLTEGEGPVASSTTLTPCGAKIGKQSIM